MKTDKQLLSLNKTDLLKEYRELESKLQNVATNTKEPTLDEAIKIVEQNNMTLKKKTSYHFQEGYNE